MLRVLRWQRYTNTYTYQEHQPCCSFRLVVLSMTKCEKAFLYWRQLRNIKKWEQLTAVTKVHVKYSGVMSTLCSVSCLSGRDIYSRQFWCHCLTGAPLATILKVDIITGNWKLQLIRIRYSLNYWLPRCNSLELLCIVTTWKYCFQCILFAMAQWRDLWYFMHCWPI